MKVHTAGYRLALSWLVTIVMTSTVVAEVPRYAAMLANGQRLEGNKFTDWHHRSQKPKLDGKELTNDGNPLLWLRDRHTRPAERPTSFVEMINGDRLPGIVTAFDGADGPTQWESLPPYFVARPTIDVAYPRSKTASDVRIISRYVRRIVWQARPGSEQYQPGTLYYKDGRTIKFRAARFAGNRVHLLQATGQTSVSFREIAQLHLPRQDAWESYYDSLAVLSPDLEDRLLQFETTDGRLFTGSTMQFIAMTVGNAGESSNWYHALQPAWSLDVLWTGNDAIWMRRSWSPEQVPLTHIDPTESISRSVLMTGERYPQRNVNSTGSALQAAGQSHGWGFGVHAYSELHFPLPTIATTFRTRVGLDDAVGTGGCSIARVYVDSIESKPLYQSPHLVGSASLQDTQNLNINNAAKEGKSLILQVDPAHAGRPANADPFDIRDQTDWLEPTVTLDREQLAALVKSRRASRVYAFDGWALEHSDTGDIKWRSDRQREDDTGPSGFRPQIQLRKEILTLRRELTVGPEDRWLVISVYRRRGESSEPELIVRVDGIEVAARPVPLRDGERLPTPLVVALSPYAGHTIDLEIEQREPVDGYFPPVFWHGLKISDQLPILHRAFEDEETITASIDDAGKTTAEIFADDAYYGKQSLRLQPGGGATLNFAEPLKIRGNPQFGEQRFLRFAIRKRGNGNVKLELLRTGAQAPRAIYNAGQPLKDVKIEDDPRRPVKRVLAWQNDLPDRWVVITRDVYGDFGDSEVSGIRVHVTDGEQAQVDHIYFARTADDFKLLPQPLSPAITDDDARRELTRAVLEKGHPATVAILIDERQATGVLIGGSALVLTAGHVFGRADRDCEIQLPSGQRLPAKTRGIYRGADVGLIQITDRKGVELRGLELNYEKEFPSDQLYVGFALEPFEVETPGAVTQVVSLQQDFPETVLTDFRLARTTTGGPLLDREGRVVGTQICDSRFGGFLYSKSFVAGQNLERMKRGEVYGEWFPGSGPMLGVIIKSTNAGAQITEVFADSPAAAADVQVGDVLVQLDGHPVKSLEDAYHLLAARNPGDEVATEFMRGEQKLPKKIKLMMRTP